nr:hypothetical protein [Sinorhizobium fredii]
MREINSARIRTDQKRQSGRKEDRIPAADQRHDEDGRDEREEKAIADEFGQCQSQRKTLDIAVAARK